MRSPRQRNVEEELETLEASSLVDEMDEEEAEDDENSGGEDGDGEDEQTDDEDEESDEEDEPEVGIAMELPKRSTRGSRYAALVGDAMQQDTEFWRHNTWAEDEEDFEYNCSEGEEQYKDIIDSDFDEDKSEGDDDDEEDDDDLEAAERKALKKKSVYVDPSLVAKKKARIAKAKARSPSKNAALSKPPTRPVSPPPVKRGEIVDEIDLSAIPTEVKRSKRATTKQKTEAMLALEKEREHKRVKMAERRERALQRKKAAGMVEEYREPTQEEHLAEAKLTEQENIASLKCLQAWEEERKRYQEYKRQAYKGHYAVYVCWASDRLIVTEDEEQGWSGSAVGPPTVSETAAESKVGEGSSLGVPQHGEAAASRSEPKSECYGKGADATDSQVKDVWVAPATPESERNTCQEEEIKIPKKKKPVSVAVVEEEPPKSKTTDITASQGPFYAADHYSRGSILVKDEEAEASDGMDIEEEVYAKELLIFTDGQLPELYSMSIVPKSSPPACAVTGKPAHYFDPLTLKYYASKEAFRILRQWHNDQRDKEIYHDLDEIEKMLLDKQQQVYKAVIGIYSPSSTLASTNASYSVADPAHYGIGDSSIKTNPITGYQERHSNHVPKTERSGVGRRR